MKLLVSTRKGLVICDQKNGHWHQESVHFHGIPICLAYYHPVQEALWAFQDHGHWGIKMSKSKDFGRTWQEVEAPKFPEGAEVKDGLPASLTYVWAAQHVGDTLWLGTVPGGSSKLKIRVRHGN